MRYYVRAAKSQEQRKVRQKISESVNSRGSPGTKKNRLILEYSLTLNFLNMFCWVFRSAGEARGVTWHTKQRKVTSKHQDACF